MATKPRIQIDITRVQELAGRGLTRAEIAAVLGISETTLYNRRRESEEFDAAIKSGKAIAAQEVANALYQKAIVEKDLGAIIWYEKTRRGLSDKQQVEHSGGIKHYTVDIDSINDTTDPDAQA